MREKELRLALVCYGGISLAIYMHGITKEIWRLTRASRDFRDNAPPSGGTQAVYRRVLQEIGRATGRERVGKYELTLVVAVSLQIMNEYADKDKYAQHSQP